MPTPGHNKLLWTASASLGRFLFHGALFLVQFIGARRRLGCQPLSLKPSGFLPHDFALGFYDRLGFVVHPLRLWKRLSACDRDLSSANISHAFGWRASIARFVMPRALALSRWLDAVELDWDAGLQCGPLTVVR
jgi:hypothetical protein